MFKKRSLATAAAAALCFASASHADQLLQQGLPPRPVTFVEFEGDKLVYQTRSGDRNDIALDRISHIVVDGETAFNEAEVAVSKNEAAKGVDGYIKTLRSTTKPWLKLYASRRLLNALGNTDRFDAKLVAYLAILTTAPDAAANLRPALPPKGNRQLDAAVTDIESALKTPNLPGPQQLALFNFLIDVQRQRGDEAAIAQVLERIDRASATLGDVPEVKAQLAGLKVNQARVALDQKRYAEAAKIIDDNKANITDPRQQCDALFVLAEAKHATVNKGDKDAMKDVALMYMRVVAHFGDLEGKPNALPALQHTAAILEQIGEKDAAAAVLEQIAAEYEKDPAAAGKAKADLKRLKPAA